MQVFSTIIPIFAVVILGLIARKKGFMPPAFLEPANRLVYFLAIPAMIFRSVTKASFATEFNVTVLLVRHLVGMPAILNQVLNKARHGCLSIQVSLSPETRKATGSPGSHAPAWSPMRGEMIVPL